MTQYIDKNRVEEILRNLWKKDDGYNTEHRICYNKALQEVQCELDTLEVKETPDSANLEEEIENELERTWYGEYLDTDKFKESAVYFYELGLKAKRE